MRTLIALGGNALLRRGEPPDAAVQLAHVRAAAAALADVARTDQLVVTHGNGPQVGLLAVESSDDRGLSAPYPLDALVAETQGLIGYWLQQSIASARAGTRVVSLITQTLVDPDDPAFDHPTKFVGGGTSEGGAQALAARHGWQFARDGERWRRVVASPAPTGVVERPIVADLLAAGTTVVCAGGGGCAVVETSGELRGVEAVVDKDAVAALLARELDVDRLVLVTDVDAVERGFGTPAARPIGEVRAADLDPSAFPAGSMGPKVAAACRFAVETGRPATIGSLDRLADVVRGAAGTRILP